MDFPEGLQDAEGKAHGRFVSGTQPIPIAAKVRLPEREGSRVSEESKQRHLHGHPAAPVQMESRG